MSDQLETPDVDVREIDEQPDVATRTVGAAGAAATAAIGAEAVGGQASLWSDAWLELRRNPLFLGPLVIILVLTVMAIAPQLFTSVDPNDCGLGNSLIPPNSEHWFGTDIQGCDYYARVIYGARISIIIGLTVAGATFLIGSVLGGLAGFYSGGIDAVLARITDIWFAIPTILGGVIILSVVQDKGVIQVALVLIILGWPTLMRIMRSQVLSVKEMDYVAAARALGGNDLRLVLRHIVPNSIAPVVVYTTIFVGIAIVSEATLSFLGIGVQLPAISWGLQLSQAQQRLLTNPWLLIFPGAFLSVTVLSFIVMGDALRDALDPKLR